MRLPWEFTYPWTVVPLRYLPGTFAVLFVVQAAYLMGAAIVEHTCRCDLTLSELLRLQMSERMVFSRFAFKFSSFVPNCDSLRLSMRCPRLRQIGGTLLAEMHFAFPDGCEGTCTVLIARDHDFQQKDRDGTTETKI